MKKIVIIFLLLIPILVSAQLELDYPELPGGEDITEGTNFAQYIEYFYNFSFSIAGLIAFLSLTYGGYLYLTAAGSPDRIGEAKSRIFSALLGIGILVLSYVILIFINPDLTTLVLPTLEEPPGFVEEEIISDISKSNYLGTVKEIGYMGGLAAESVNELGDDIFNSSLACACFFANSLCLCTGGSESDTCEPQMCYTGSDGSGHPCLDYPRIKRNQELIIFRLNELVYYQNRALGEGFLDEGFSMDIDELIGGLTEVITDILSGLDFDSLPDSATEEAISLLIGGEAERVYWEMVNTVIPKGAYYEQLLASETDSDIYNYLLEQRERITRNQELMQDLIEELIEFSALVEALKGPVSELAELPDECALRVQEECEAECITVEESQCHDTFLGCRSVCMGLNPCPVIEIALVYGQVEILSSLIEDSTEEIMSIVDELRENRI